MNYFRIIFLFLYLFLSTPLWSQTSKDTSTSSNKTTSLHPKQMSNRPNAPVRYIIECTYTSGSLWLEIPQQIGSVEICIKNEAEIVWYGIATIDEPFCEIPVLEGTYTIVCTTMTGTEFIGTLDF